MGHPAIVRIVLGRMGAVQFLYAEW
jgi:hypothetical protein